MPDFAAIVATPVFALGVRCSDDEVTGTEFLPPQAEVRPGGLLAREVVRQLRIWLHEPDFTFSLPLQVAGTPFQRRVWNAIAAIPLGSTRTYGELAHQLVSGPRAVGGACGANPYPVIIPCHRVVAASGLGGFGQGRGSFPLEIKRWLLAREQR